MGGSLSEEFERVKAERPLTNASGDTLLRLTQENQDAFLRRWSICPNVDFRDDGKVKRMVMGTQFPLCNPIFGAKLSRSGANQVVHGVVEESARMRVPRLWIVDSRTTPHDIGKTLLENGFKLVAENTAMSLDLRHLPSGKPLPADFGIEPVEDEKSLESFVSTMDRAFDVPQSDDRILRSAEKSLMKCGKDYCQRYLGSMSGSPAAVSLLLRTPRVAGIYCVGTLDKFRNKGIGAAMTLRAAEEAAGLGYNYCVLHATSVGHPVYRSIGFEDLGKDGLYYYGPPAGGTH